MLADATAAEYLLYYIGIFLLFAVPLGGLIVGLIWVSRREREDGWRRD